MDFPYFGPIDEPTPYAGSLPASWRLLLLFSNPSGLPLRVKVEALSQRNFSKAPDDTLTSTLRSALPPAPLSASFGLPGSVLSVGAADGTWTRCLSRDPVHFLLLPHPRPPHGTPPPPHPPPQPQVPNQACRRFLCHCKAEGCLSPLSFRLAPLSDTPRSPLWAASVVEPS